MSDIDIARKAKKIHIRDVASKINIPEENLIPYGHDIAKIDFNFIEKK
jgi:formate--tetrahydrofolate ligase